MAKVEIRRATEDDIKAFFAKTQPDQEHFPTLVSWIAFLDDEPVSLFGVARVSGRWLAFLDLVDEARPYKKHIIRTAKQVMREIEKMNIKYVYATIDENEPMAERFQRMLGFEPYTDNMMRWTKRGG